MLDDLKDVWTTGRRWCCGNLSACSSTSCRNAFNLFNPCKISKRPKQSVMLLVVVIKVRKSIASLPDVWADVIGTVSLNKHDKLSTIPWSSNNWNRDLIFCRTIVQCFVGKNITQWLFQSKILWILKKSIFLLLLATYFAEKGFKAWRHHFPETTCFILSQIYTLDL